MADDTGSHGEGENQQSPGDTDLSALLQILVRTQGHETDDDMRHAKVAQTPAQTGQHILPVGEQLPVVFGQLTHGGGATVGRDDCKGKNGSNQQCAQHQQTLEEVGPANCGEAAQEGVADDNDSGNVHSNGGINADNGVKQCTASLNTGSSIDGVGNQKDRGADDLQCLAAGQKTVGQILRNRDGVLGSDGILTQPGSLHQPADSIADGQADGDPGLAQTCCVNGCGQTHQNPGTHIGSTGRQGGDPGTHLTATQKVPLFSSILGLQEEVHTDAYHEYQVDNKDKYFSIHFSYLPSRLVSAGNKYESLYRICRKITMVIMHKNECVSDMFFVKIHLCTVHG